jgi:curved DNA-binding protein CbpA
MTKSAPRPVAQGTLEEKPLVHVLVYLDKNEMTGTLTIFPDPEATEEPKGQDLVYFEKGRPVAARLIRDADSLEHGLLPLFERRRSPFGFYQTDLVSGSSRKLEGEIDPLALIARSLRQTAREEVVREVLRRIGSSTLRLAPGARLERFRLEPKERALIELLQAEPTDAESLIRNTDLPRQMAERLVYLLAITKSVAIYESEKPANGGPEQREPSAQPRSESTSALRQAPADAAAAPERHAERWMRGAVAASQPAARPPSRPAMDARVASASPEGSDLPGVDPGREEGLADRGRPEGPQPAQRAPAGPVAGPVAAPTRRNESYPPPPGDLTPELTMRWMEIINLSNDIENQTYFRVLGVDRNAEPSEVKAAYFELAKLWHPDRLPPELLPLKERVQVVFHHMSQAHEHLTDEEKRIEYLKSVDEGGGTPAADRELKRKLDAAMDFMKVEVLTRRQRFDHALELLEKVLEADDQEASYHATRAFILMNKHLGKDAPFAEMLRSLDRALELDSMYENAFFYRGQIYRRMGRKEEAQEEFNKVLAINPKNIAAQREVRVERIRRSSSQSRRISNLVSLVFGKKEK